MDLVIGVGFIFTDDLTQLAKEYPNVRFAGDRLRAAGRRRRQRHPAAGQPGRAQVPRGGRLVPRRRARGARRELEEGRLRRRDGLPAHPQVRGGLQGRREAGLPRLPGDRAVRRRHARSVPQSGPRQGARAQPVPAGRQRHLPRVGLHRARRVRGGAATRQARHRRRRRPVRRRRRASCSRRW